METESKKRIDINKETSEKNNDRSTDKKDIEQMPIDERNLD